MMFAWPSTKSSEKVMLGCITRLSGLRWATQGARGSLIFKVMQQYCKCHVSVQSLGKDLCTSIQSNQCFGFWSQLVRPISGLLYFSVWLLVHLVFSVYRVFLMADRHPQTKEYRMCRSARSMPPCCRALKRPEIYYYRLVNVHS